MWYIVWVYVGGLLKCEIISSLHFWLSKVKPLQENLNKSLDFPCLSTSKKGKANQCIKISEEMISKILHDVPFLIRSTLSKNYMSCSNFIPLEKQNVYAALEVHFIDKISSLINIHKYMRNM